jgi:hypothetical protein
MNYKNYIYILTIILLNSCTIDNLSTNKVIYDFHNKFNSKGFALIYTEELYKEKIVSKKIDERSLLIFQRNLKKGTTVKIVNIRNNKILIAKVAGKSAYPKFNNSVITPRIADILELDYNEPYVEIISIPENSMFVAKTAKTFDEEKQIAAKAPVESISVNIINKKKNIEQKIERKFSYTIKIADFYFKKTALSMSKRIKDETNIKNPKIVRISDNIYRVYLGPFLNINSLQNSFNDISIFEFENIEIIKND